MKIALITNNLFMFYKFRKELVKKLCGEHEVLLMVPLEDSVLGEIDFSQYFKDLGCRLIDIKMSRRGMNPLDELNLLKIYRMHLKKERPDMVVTYSIKPNIYAGLVCGRLKIPYCANVTGLGTAFERKGLASAAAAMYRMGFRRVKTVFFENDHNRRFFIQNRIVKEEKTCLLNGAGVNLEEFAYEPYPKTETTRFVFVGRVMKEKGVEELFEAARRLEDDWEDMELHMVGPMEDDYKERMEELTRSGAVIYHGLQKDVRPFLGESHCLVLPSWHEGMANTILEASAVGRPVIASDIPGCRESVGDGVSGLLTKVRDADDLYRKMKQFLKMSREEQEQMGKNARRRMEQEFDKNAVVEKTVKEIYR